MKQLTRLLWLAQETREPTVASIPRILTRAIMHTIARVTLLVAGALLIAGVAVLYVSFVLATFPSTHGKR
jgi:hypothetical protein